MFTQRFVQIDHLLQQHRLYWQFQPFEQHDYPWREIHPSLCSWLEQQSDQSLYQWAEDPGQALQRCQPFIAALADLPGLLSLPMAGEALEAPFWLKTAVKGRKWQQISRFSSLVPESQEPLLEWCAGKGHLGRVLGWRDRRPVLSLEWQSSLCQEGEQLAHKVKIEQQFACTNVLTQNTSPHFANTHTVTALHACGQLHIEMLRQAARHGSSQICLSPCCYQLIPDTQYCPLSKAGQTSTLTLSRSDLRLAVQETVTATSRDTKRRQTERLYRLVFDNWQRQVNNSNSYLNVPPVPHSLLKEDVLAFCQWAAKQKELPAPREEQLPSLFEHAQVRAKQIQRMEWVQHQFRRALELWLVLDRCLYLEEEGYQVELMTFCERQVSPRNLFIRAKKSVNSSADA
ncbi:methyltransferase [Aliiglaciecola sp. CAU 1673]|uniref:methyltransferase n=1 Tax=Aliiglaciecola sp. CAU 1673 TaxID=3032595 RepID=UPI0023DBD6A9|nr:methyltransferase [Aliiglaciecola sp. CAU 1673]MDF2177896.1 methyltransferase [Aliiglaciecola sp. CAU 1673]